MTAGPFSVRKTLCAPGILAHLSRAQPPSLPRSKHHALRPRGRGYRPSVYPAPAVSPPPSLPQLAGSVSARGRGRRDPFTRLPLSLVGVPARAGAYQLARVASGARRIFRRGRLRVAAGGSAPTQLFLRHAAALGWREGAVKNCAGFAHGGGKVSAPVLCVFEREGGGGG